MAELNVPGVLSWMIDARAVPAVLHERVAGCRLEEKWHPGQRLVAVERRASEELAAGRDRDRGGGRRAARGGHVGRRGRSSACRKQADQRTASESEGRGAVFAGRKRRRGQAEGPVWRGGNVLHSWDGSLFVGSGVNASSRPWCSGGRTVRSVRWDHLAALINNSRIREHDCSTEHACRAECASVIAAQDETCAVERNGNESLSRRAGRIR